MPIDNPVETIPAIFLAGFLILFGIALLANIFGDSDNDHHDH